MCAPHSFVLPLAFIRVSLIIFHRVPFTSEISFDFQTIFLQHNDTQYHQHHDVLSTIRLRQHRYYVFFAKAFSLASRLAGCQKQTSGVSAI
jgi:hypothetical protein